MSQISDQSYSIQFKENPILILKNLFVSQPGGSQHGCYNQGDQKIRKIANFFQKIAKKVAKSKKGQNIYNKPLLKP